MALDPGSSRRPLRKLLRRGRSLLLCCSWAAGARNRNGRANKAETHQIGTFQRFPLQLWAPASLLCCSWAAGARQIGTFQRAANPFRASPTARRARTRLRSSTRVCSCCFSRRGTAQAQAADLCAAAACSNECAAGRNTAPAANPCVSGLVAGSFALSPTDGPKRQWESPSEAPAPNQRFTVAPWFYPPVAVLCAHAASPGVKLVRRSRVLEPLRRRLLGAPALACYCPPLLFLGHPKQPTERGRNAPNQHFSAAPFQASLRASRCSFGLSPADGCLVFDAGTERL